MTPPLVTSQLTRTSTPTRDTTKDELLYTLLGAVFFVIPFLWEYLITKTTFPFVDLPSFYFAAKAAIISGRSPFDYSVLSSYELEAGQHIFPFFYNPSSLLFFAPLLVVPYAMAGVVVLVLNHLLALVCGYLSLRRLFEIQTPSLLLIGIAILALSQPLAINHLSGQVNLLVLLCLLLFAEREARGDSGWKAALPLAIAIIIKTYPVAFLGMLISLGRWRTLVWCVGFVGGISLASLPLIPLSIWHSWFTNVLPYTGYGITPPHLFSPSSPYNQSLNGFFMRLGQLYSGYELLLTWSSVLLAIGFTFGVSFLSRKAPLPLHFVAFTLLTLIIAPLTWEHHLVFCIPALGLVLSQWERGETKAIPLLIATLSLFAISWKLPFDHPWLMTGGRKTLLISVKLYGVLALWVFSLLQLRVRSSYQLLCSDAGSSEEVSRQPLSSREGRDRGRPRHLCP